MRRLAYMVSLSSALVCACNASPAPDEPRPGDPDSPDGALSCDGLEDGARIERTRFAEGTVTAPASCRSELQVARCENGEVSAWSGTYTFEECQVLASRDECAGLPDGTTVTRTRYAEEAPLPGQPCRAEEQLATCANGSASSWSGSYPASSCAETALGCGSLKEGEETTRVRYKLPIASDTESCEELAETQRGVCTGGELVFDGTYREEHCGEEYTDDCGTLLTSRASAPCMRVPLGNQMSAHPLTDKSWQMEQVRLDGDHAHVLARESRGLGYYNVVLAEVALDGTPRALNPVTVWAIEPEGNLHLSELRHGMRAAYTDTAVPGPDVIVYAVENGIQQVLTWDNPSHFLSSVVLTEDALWTATFGAGDGCQIRRVALDTGTETRMDRQMIMPEGGALNADGCGVFGDGESFYVAAQPESPPPHVTSIYRFDPSSSAPALTRIASFEAQYIIEDAAVDGGYLTVKQGLNTYVIDAAHPERVQAVESLGLAQIHGSMIYAPQGSGHTTVHALGGRHMYTLPFRPRSMDIRDGVLYAADDESVSALDLAHTRDLTPLKLVLGQACSVSGSTALCSNDSGSTIYVRDAAGDYVPRHTLESVPAGAQRSFLADANHTVVLTKGDENRVTVLDHVSGAVDTLTLSRFPSLRSVDRGALLTVSTGAGVVVRTDLDTLRTAATWTLPGAPVLENGVLWTVEANGLLAGRVAEHTLSEAPLSTLPLPGAYPSYFALLSGPFESQERSLIALANEMDDLVVLVEVSDPSRPRLLHTFETVDGYYQTLFTSDDFALVRSGLSTPAEFSRLYDLETGADLMVYGNNELDLTKDGRLRAATREGVFESEPIPFP